VKTILLIENGSRHTRAFAHYLAPYRVVRRRYRDLTPASLDAVDIIILTGGHPSVLHHAWFYRRQLELIRTTTKPVIGVCLGFELIVRAYGGRLHRLPRKARGIRIITVVSDALALGREHLRVWEAHKWAAPAVPDDVFTVIARSATGAEIIRHRTRPVYGLQFHPEVREPANDGSEVLTSILSRL
jgi:GMP synthase (glutamine-hydrolysing)